MNHVTDSSTWHFVVFFSQAYFYTALMAAVTSIYVYILTIVLTTNQNLIIVAVI